MMAPDRLRAFLHDVQRGALTRAGYARVYLSWVGQPATKAQKADAEAALRLGLIAWPGMTPGTAATLTDSGRALLGGLKDHEVRHLVNELRDTALKFHAHGSLRDRIAQIVVPCLRREVRK